MEKLQEGLVKGVLSGDTVIISGKMKKNNDEAPEEKFFYLSLVTAPRSGSSNNLEEEAFAWDSRDCLRKQILGKVVKYTVDYKSNERVYGQIFYEGKNVNIDLVKSGLAKIGFVPRNENVSKSEYYSNLQAAENEAKKAKLNIWSTDSGYVASHKRQLHSSQDSNFDYNEFFKKVKDREIDVMVDYVINCAVYSVFVTEINTFIKLNLRFVAIPNAKDNVLYKAGKAYAERLVLHKNIKAVIHAVDSDKGLIGDLADKKGPISAFLIKSGYSKLFISNNIPYTTEELNEIKSSQKTAKKERLRIWKNEKGDEDEDEERKEKLNGKSNNEFDAICTQIHSGDSLSVKNLSTGEVSRIFLSHLKAPKFGKPNTEEKDQPWAFQAKEFLRKTLVGKKLRLEHDYSKTLEDGKKMNFYSVFRYVQDNGKIKENKDQTVPASKEKNVNVELIESGYASYISPNLKLDDGVSKYIDTYQASEKTAKEKKAGIHSSKFPSNPNYSDLISANKTKKKEFVNFLLNQKNLQCVVEYCFTGSKFKLRIENSKCYIPFSLLGVKTFGKDANNTDLQEKFFKEAVEFSNDHLLQRECVCDIISADRVGNYFGYLTINGQNYGTTLLKEGLGVVNVGFGNTAIIHLNDFKAAEKSAEQAAKNIWAHGNLASFLREGDVNFALPKSYEEKHSDVKLVVTDYIDFNNFFINILPNKSLEQIEAVLNNYNSGVAKPVPFEAPIRVGTICAAKYSVDNRFYRGKILKGLKTDSYEVELIDFGTIDNFAKKDLFKLDSSVTIIEAQAVLCELAYLKYSKNSMKKALETITDFVNIDLILPGKICYNYSYDGRIKYGIVVYQKKDKKVKDTYHHDLIKLGYAKFDVKKSVPDYLADLKEVEKKSEKMEIGLWAENEQTDYDEVEEADY